MGPGVPAGRLRILGKDGSLGEPVAGVPKVDTTRRGGLLGVAVDPRFRHNATIFFSFAEARGGGTNGTSVARARLGEHGLAAKELARLELRDNRVVHEERLF